MSDLVGHSYLDLLKILIPKGPWALAAIVPDKDIVSTRGFMPGRTNEEALKQWLKAFNGTRNIYFQPGILGTDGGSKAKKEHVSAVSAWWVDVDPFVTPQTTFEDERARILELLTTKRPEHVPPPSVIIDSGNGYQAYWLMRDHFYVEAKPANVERFEAYNRQIAAAFGADHCWAINNLMRLPGVFNISSAKKFTDKGYPEGKREAKVVHFDPKLVYSWEDFKAPAEGAGVALAIDDETRALSQLTPGAAVRRFESEEELQNDLLAHGVGMHVFWSIVEKDLDELYQRHMATKLHPQAVVKRFASHSERHQSIITALGTAQVPYTVDEVFGIISDPRWPGANQHYRTLDVGQQRRSIQRSYAKGVTMVKAEREKAVHVEQRTENAIATQEDKVAEKAAKAAKKREEKAAQAEARGFSFPDGLEDKPTAKGFPPRLTLNNIAAGLRAIGVQARHNIFKNRTIVEATFEERRATLTTMVGGELSDPALLGLRSMFTTEYGVEPSSDKMKEAVEFMAQHNAFDPIVDYLDSLPEWDNVERLSAWLHTYFGVDDDDLHRNFAKLTLMGAVKRAIEPGCKFDTALVLEGPEGKNKSSALRILAGEEYFSDQQILGLDDVKLMEQLEGHWINECAELKGIKKTENDHAKTILSRQEDRGRRAWARMPERVKRRGIIIGTSNDDAYLTGEYGENRRWWPARITRAADLDALARNRDRLWAEALFYVRRGDSVVLPEGLWDAAKQLQASRMTDSTPWDEDIEAYANGIMPAANGYQYFVISKFLSDILRMDIDKHTNAHKLSIGRHLKKIGFLRYSDGSTRSYRRLMPKSNGIQHEMEQFLDLPQKPDATGV